MTAVKTEETAPSAKRVEAWTILPEEVAIYAPAPPKEVVTIEWPNPTEEDPKGVMKVVVALTGDNDRHGETLPDFDHSFDWDVTSEEARGHIATYVTRGCAMVNFDGRLYQGVNVTCNGRHRVLQARVANQIRAMLGEKPCKIAMRRMVIPDSYASTFSLIANKTYKRDPAALGRQYAKAMAERNLTPEELGAELGKSASTVRRFVLLGQGKTKKTEQKRTRTGLAKPQQRRLFEDLKKRSMAVDDPGLTAALTVVEAMLYGKLPDDAPPFLRAAWKAIQKDKDKS
jgi:hypothetical protein